MEEKKKNNLKWLILAIIVLLIVATIVLFLTKNNVKEIDDVEVVGNKENITYDIFKRDEDINLNSGEIVASKFQIEFDEALNKWAILFVVDKKDVENADDYGNYYIYFSGENDEFLGYTYASMFNNLKEGKNNCIVNVDFDARLISKITIKKMAS